MNAFRSVKQRHAGWNRLTLRRKARPALGSSIVVPRGIHHAVGSSMAPGNQGRRAAALHLLSGKVGSAM